MRCLVVLITCVWACFPSGAASALDILWEKEPGIRIDHFDGYGNIGYGCSIVRIEGGEYRMYFTGASPYAILSARSTDGGCSWTVEEGIRVYAGSDPYVIELGDGSYRMYYTGFDPRWRICSAVSSDGINWVKESGNRLTGGGTYTPYGVAHPCVMVLADGTYLMYFTGVGPTWRILSAVSEDGLNWVQEEGVRVDVGGPYDEGHAGNPKVITLPDGTLKMYYAGTNYEGPDRVSRVLSVSSVDGFLWTKDPGIVIDVGGEFDLYHAIPSGIFKFGDTYRMFYEASSVPDGYHWRILSAVGIVLLSC